VQNKRKESWWSRLKLNLLLLLGLLVLSGLLGACATKSPASTPAQPPQVPKPPATLMKPASPESYLERAQRNIETWQQKLTGSATK
jgi:hypothetical protein